MFDESRRRKQAAPFWPSMLWLALGVVVVGGGVGFLSRGSRVPPATPLPASGFDLKDPLPSPPMREERRSSLPLGVGSLSAGGAKPAPLAAPTPDQLIQKDSRFQALLEAPAKFMIKKTLLGSSKGLAAFLADPKRTARYTAHPLVSGVLKSPALVRALVRPATIRAFIASPAMSDPAVVKALARSPLVQEIFEAHGVHECLKNTAFVNQVLLDPQATAWLGRNPEALKALSQFGPAFAAAAMRR